MVDEPSEGDVVVHAGGSDEHEAGRLGAAFRLHAQGDFEDGGGSVAVADEQRLLDIEGAEQIADVDGLLGGGVVVGARLAASAEAEQLDNDDAVVFGQLGVNKHPVGQRQAQAVDKDQRSGGIGRADIALDHGAVGPVVHAEALVELGGSVAPGGLGGAAGQDNQAEDKARADPRNTLHRASGSRALAGGRWIDMPGKAARAAPACYRDDGIGLGAMRADALYVWGMGPGGSAGL